jgi:hypothetical protein
MPSKSQRLVLRDQSFDCDAVSLADSCRQYGPDATFCLDDFDIVVCLGNDRCDYGPCADENKCLTRSNGIGVCGEILGSP